MNDNNDRYNHIITPNRLKWLSMYITYLTYMAFFKIIFIGLNTIPERPTHFKGVSNGYTMDSINVDIKWEAYYKHRIYWEPVNIDTMNSELQKLVDDELKFFLSKTPYNIFIKMKKEEMVIERTNTTLILFPKN